MGLSFTEKAILLPNRSISPRLDTKIVEYFNLVHAHKPKVFFFGLSFFVRLPVPNFFLALFLSLLFLPPFAFHILSGCPKKLGVYQG